VADGYQFQFVAGALCLDFANTVGGRVSAEREDHLRDYAELVEWARQARIVTESHARHLRLEAEQHPQLARRTFADAISLREAISRTFSALADGPRPDTADLEHINAALPRALAHLEVAETEGGFEWRWRHDADALDCMLWPVARSAAELLLGEPAHVGTCEMDTCGWQFVDSSRNHSRRWCTMGDCGNRAKARRFYKKRKSSDP
jgi:predicted RNA-binding Zn ribbon-like protein